ncbi:mitochondrial 54S ribosomal protein [Saccharomycopsis crataegensis]|uniref:Mitochondrial 54S ribosomal protein n=1 Tax=Saccharomycopsis crataegensis TaxID=43959 RepID=A0AAV5QDQ0_9ASCO|nr:mitochondrial 54S ribosomal protein [Saccharomycopsis crataegensis]
MNKSSISILSLKPLSSNLLGSRGAKFSTSSIALAKKAQVSRDQLKKNAAKALAKKRVEAKLPVANDPLYSDISTALRYLRSAEVGRSETASTITVSSNIVGDKGAPPLTGAISFPKPLKEVRVLVFTEDAVQAKVAQDLGAALVGGQELVEQIKEGKLGLNFNKAFATPDMQGQLAPLARTLGPKGLMPNAKKGTMATDLESVLKGAVGTMPFKQKSGLLSIAVGRTSFSDVEIIKNIMAASEAVKTATTTIKSKRPPIIGHTTITSTNGPAFKIDF